MTLGTARGRAWTYEVALSFSGDDRHIARSIANGLRSAGMKVFFYEFEKDRLWGSNLVDILTSVYSGQRHDFA